MSDNENDNIGNKVESDESIDLDSKIKDEGEDDVKSGSKNKLLEELMYKFSYLNDLKPSNSKNSIQTKNSIDDTFIYKLNPERFMFYQEFMREIKQNPELIKKIIYENKLIKYKKEEEAKILENIINNFESLFAVSGIPTDNNKSYLDARKAKVQNETKNIQDKLSSIISSQETLDSGLYGEDNDKIMTKKKDLIKSTFQDLSGQEETKAEPPALKNGGMRRNKFYKGGSNKSKDYKSKIKKMEQNFKGNSILKKYSNKLSDIHENDNIQDKTKAMMLKDVVNEIEEDKFVSIKSLDLSKEDRLLFVGITFVLRLICLGIVDWSLSTNFVSAFTSAFILYIAIYSLFIFLILIVVNMQYAVPIGELYTSDHSLFTAIAGSMYYFYMRPGHFLSSITRFIIHLGIIVSITVIALLIKDNNQKSGSLSYNYLEKKQIRKSVHNFTFLMWIFTSFIAMYL